MHYKTTYNLYRHGCKTTLDVVYDYREVDLSAGLEQMKIITISPACKLSAEEKEGLELHCWIDVDMHLARQLLNEGIAKVPLI